MAQIIIRCARFAFILSRPLGLSAFLLSCFLGSNLDVRAQATEAKPAAHLVLASTSSAALPRTITESAFSSVRSANGNVPSLADAAPIERRAFEMINSIRVKNGMSALQWDPELCRIARAHSQNMARNGFFSHISPEGLSPKDRVLDAGVKPFRVLAENIAYNQGYDDPGAFAVERWMISPGHRENILSREFQASAIGVFVNSEGCVYLTELFILR